LLSILSVIVGAGLAVAAPFPESPMLSYAQWVPEQGDYAVVDTEANMFYLYHPDGRVLIDVAGSGQKRTVSYAGRVYDAPTPDDVWRIGEVVVQSDRITFGDDGIFLRLFADDGKTYTKYGIHTVQGQHLFSQQNRHISMGCVLVRKDLRLLLEKEVELHKGGDGFMVITVRGFNPTHPLMTLASAGA
jgi:hypothetical protein